MAIAPVMKTPRELYRKQLLEGLEEKKQKIYDGSMEGTEIVTWQDVERVAWAPMLPPSEHGVEASTPVRVVVFAFCPRCGQSAPIALDVTPELRVDGQGGHLHLKGKSKPVTHICGQLLAGMGADEDQEGFELEDIVGEAQAAVDEAADDIVSEAADQDAEADEMTSIADDDSDAPLLPEAGAPADDTIVKACDWPRCMLPLGHDGPHDVPPDAPRLPVDDTFDDIPF